MIQTPSGEIKRQKSYDAQGNDSQDVAFNSEGEVDLKYEHIHESDQFRNWTKHMMKVWEKQDSALAHTYTMTHKRTISYFP